MLRSSRLFNAGRRFVQQERCVLYRYIPSCSISSPQRRDKDQLYDLRYTSTIRLFSSDNQQDRDSPPPLPLAAPTMRERAEQHARNIRSSSAKAARKGAKSAGAMMKQYGPVFVGTYFSIYWSFLALLYGGVDSGLVDPLTLIQFIKSNSSETETTTTTVEYVVEVMNHYSLTAPYAPYFERNPHFANLALAWIGVKFTEPVRLALTIAVVPRVARYFGMVKKDEENEHNEKGKTDEEHNATTEGRYDQTAPMDSKEATKDKA